MSDYRITSKCRVCRKLIYWDNVQFVWVHISSHNLKLHTPDPDGSEASA